MSLAIKHKIRVPPEYTMLGRAGATIEGIVRDFDPEIDVARIAGPYAERLLFGRVGPDQLQGGMYRLLLQMQGLSQDLPLQLSQILSDLAAGNFATNVRGAALDRITSTLLVATTAISLSILGGAFVIGAFMALSQVQWSVYGVPVVAILASAAGGTIFSWVSAYILLRPRLKKLRLRDWIGRGRRGIGGRPSDPP